METAPDTAAAPPSPPRPAPAEAPTEAPSPSSRPEPARRGFRLTEEGRRAGERAFYGMFAGMFVLMVVGLCGGYQLVVRPLLHPSTSATSGGTAGASGTANGASGAPARGTTGFAAVRARGELRVAADPDAPPFLKRTDAGWEGFEYGVMTAIAAEIGVPVAVVELPFSALDDAVRDGLADLAIGQLSPSSAYDGLQFSVSYLQYSLCLVVPAKSRVRTLPELRGKRVGLYDDPVARQVTAVGVGASFESRTFQDYGYFEALGAGELDAVVYDCPLVRAELRRFPDLRIVDDALNVATYSVAAADPQLVTDVDRVLRDLGDQGLLARLESTWLGNAAPTEGYRTATGRVVVLRRGDTLRSVAARELGDEARWTELHAANRDVVGDDPERLYAGLRLRVPAGR